MSFGVIPDGFGSLGERPLANARRVGKIAIAVDTIVHQTTLRQLEADINCAMHVGI
jgi:hypothetical protein